MLPDLREISRRRRALGRTQTELARQAGVSQSLIAKLEAGRVDPAYSKVKQIFEKLEEIEAKQEEPTIRELANRPVVGVKLADPVGKAIGLMERHDYSQLPVFEGGRAVGSISDGAVTDYLAKGLDPGELRGRPVMELMEEASPLIEEGAPRGVAISLLRYYPAVLTTKEGKITGIVTKADLFKVARGRK